MKGLTKGNSVFVFILELFYFYSDSIDIFIKRDGDYWSKKISIENYKLVSDLLEESRSILKFKKHDQLTAHKTPHGERIDDSLPIRDVAHPRTFVIKCTEKRANHKDAATHDGNSKVIRHIGDLSKPGATRRGNTTTADHQHQSEILLLNWKLAPKVEGFVFKIVPQDYTHIYNESECISTFFSDKEHEEKRSEIRVTQCWSNWQPREALPCWGVRINNVDKDNQTKQSYENKNQETSKIPTAIVTKTNFYQVREFGVNVTINEQAVKEAKKILEASTRQERQNIIKEFNDKYCSFVYSGKFSAGAWLRIVATARRYKPPKGQDSANLERCAAEETEHYWSWVTQTNRSSSYRHLRHKDPSVRVSVFNVSDPRNIQNMYQLEETIRNVEYCTVFPANWDEKSYFTPVYEIMKSQAEANNDEDLRKVADIFKEYMEGKTAFSLSAHYIGYHLR